MWRLNVPPATFQAPNAPSPPVPPAGNPGNVDASLSPSPLFPFEPPVPSPPLFLITTLLSPRTVPYIKIPSDAKNLNPLVFTYKSPCVTSNITILR